MIVVQANWNVAGLSCAEHPRAARHGVLLLPQPPPRACQCRGSSAAAAAPCPQAPGVRAHHTKETPLHCHTSKPMAATPPAGGDRTGRPAGGADTAGAADAEGAQQVGGGCWCWWGKLRVWGLVWMGLRVVFAMKDNTGRRGWAVLGTDDGTWDSAEVEGARLGTQPDGRLRHGGVALPLTHPAAAHRPWCGSLQPTAFAHP